VSFDQVLSTLPPSTLALIIVLLIAAAAGHLLLRGWVRRRERREDALVAAATTTAPARRWRSRLMPEMFPPVAVLVWLHALYAALALLLRRADLWPLAATAQTALRWTYGVGLVVVLFWLLVRVGRLVEAALIAVSRRADTAWDDVMLPLAGRAVRRTLPLVALMLGLPALATSPELEEMLRTGASLLLIGIVAFVLYQAVDAVAAVVLTQHRLDVRDNLQARAVHTQVMVLKKIAVTVICIFTLASMLMVFESVRQFGASILASAGIAGIIIGFAAQRSIATLLAGFQIALTQPIRLDDVVIVENEWGRIEDITLTYVIVRIWDRRRLVVPINYFIEQPFQNWTRSSSDLLATVFLHVDYTVPLDEVRAELTRVLTSSPLWDGKVNVLQVTDSKERTLEIRALASAADASLAWDLRCEIRERLVGFLQREHPECLPRGRASVELSETSLFSRGAAGPRKEDDRIARRAATPTARPT
jgi:small-conductance mechanosensitive channel